jgi:glycosyltransferase involved in cell wall biosynthesis
VNETVRVSIVTPFLNAVRFIEESIESVLAQTYERWELLLVDDGSTDGSSAIAMRYAAAHPRKIHYLSHPHRATKGASASRNHGIRHATGEYLAFLDADDVYLPRKLEDQIPLLDGNRAAQVLYAATEYWYGWTGHPEDAARDWTWRNYGVEPNTIVAPPQMLITFLHDGGTVPCMGSVLVRREAVEAVGGWEDSFRYICTDQVFHAKLCLRYPVLIYDACWDRYRQHPDSSCQKVAAAGQSDGAFQTYLRWLERYLAEQGVSDPAVWTALRRAVRRYRYPRLHELERGAGRQARRVARAVVRMGRRALLDRR